MRNLKAELSSSSLDNLIKELEDYKSKIKSVENNLPQRLADKAADYITENVNAITEKDGNIRANSGSYGIGNEALAYLEGEQAAYLEYGTGTVGANNSHPLASEVGWDYASGERIFTTKDGRTGWIYQDKSTGQYHFTEGIPANMPVLNAAAQIKLEVDKTAKEMFE